jgi:hypothetical protein
MIGTLIHKNRKRFFSHAVILLSIAVLFSLILLVTLETVFSFGIFLNYLLQTITSIFLLLAPPIYVTIYWLIPRFIAKKKYVNYIGIVVILIVVWGSVLGFIEPWMDEHWFGQPKQDTSLQMGIAGMCFILIVTTLLHLSYKWFVQLSTIKQIENDQLHLELSSLKNQINPHFFFNTLNNLYALSLEKSDETPSVILKLSEMMRYTIYDCKEPKVSILNEITYIENFITLQKVRHHKRGVITFKNEVVDSDMQIAPMILIVFLENAFKHGFDLIEKGAFININLKIDKNKLQFYIENNFIASENENQPGIGLENVKRRLSLIYPNTHEIKIVKKSNLFSADLKLYL